MLENLSTQQRLLLATGLSVIFFVIYSAIFPPQKTEITETNKTKSENQAPNLANNGEVLTPTAPTSSPISTNNISTEDKLVTVKSKDFILTIDNFGRISTKTLLGEKYKNDKGVQAQLVTKFSPKPLEIRFEDVDLNLLAFKNEYKSDKMAIDVSHTPQKVVLTQVLDEVIVTKKLTFYPAGNYDVKIEVTGGKRFFVSNGMRPDVNEFGFVVQGAMVKVGDQITIIEDEDARGTSIFRDVMFLSSFDRYYASIFYNLAPTQNIVIEGDKFENPMVFVEGLQQVNFSAYLGAKDFEILESLNPKLTDAIEYGVITLIAEPIFYILKEFYAIFGNWGWAIVAMTLLIRLFLYPLTYKGMLSMQKLKEIAPEMKELQRKYKGNPQQLQAKMMELYKKRGANPIGGCFPLLLQIPIFFAIYRVLVNAVELQGAEWILWVDDLAKMDPYFILPILMGASMFWQQHVTPSNFTDPMQEKIFKFLPIIFTFFFITFPAGLTLYWFVNNLFSIGQQYIVNFQFAKIKAKKEAEEQK
ncbi:membrane protein insertase, YidC/Oxa1 family [Thiovulum sp. ES]|nr:membrane protein insertase, YidC/Oxa1 family [Thiovulum sp. ES]